MRILVLSALAAVGLSACQPAAEPKPVDAQPAPDASAAAQVETAPAAMLEPTPVPPVATPAPPPSPRVSAPRPARPVPTPAPTPPPPPANGVSTTPADNAMLAAAPTAFAVTFPHAMTLSSLKLTGSGGQATDVTVIADASPATTVRVPLPALAAGSYSAAWAATGADGHQMNGVVRFMVH